MKSNRTIPTHCLTSATRQVGQRARRTRLRGVKTTAIAMALVLTSGCVFSSLTEVERVGSELARYNDAVAKAQDEVLFRNIVRSMLREPRHYTAVTQLREAAQTGSVELTVPFGGSSAGYIFKPTTNWSRGPSADVAVLDSDDFIQGILAEVSLKDIGYFLRQGWPP